MKKIFFSYSNHDLCLAKFVHAYFSDLFQGNATFFLSDSIEPSKEWLNKVWSEIKSADAGLFLLTPMSVNCQWLNIEFGALWGREKKVYPVIAGELDIGDVHRPLVDFEVARLTDESSVSRLIRQISTFCGMPVPPLYDGRRFCEDVRARIVPTVTFRDIVSVSNRLALKGLPIPVTLKQSMINCEPDNLMVHILSNNTISASGAFDDSGIININIASNESIEFMLLEASNTENIQTCLERRMAKIVVNQKPIPAFFKNQQHPFDHQFIPKQNGFFVFSLGEVSTNQDFVIRIVLWRMNVQRLLLRLYFIRQELMSDINTPKMEPLASLGVAR